MKKIAFAFYMVTMVLAICLNVFGGAKSSLATTYTVDAGKTLFMRDGTHNATLRTQLINFANSIPEVGQINGRRNVNVGGVSHVGADINAIREANAGVMPVIRMFEQRQDSVLTGGSTQTLAQAADNFTMQQWMLVYITFPVSGQPVFTFMMTNPYRNQRFNPSPATPIVYDRNLYCNIGDGVGDPATFNDTDGSEVRNQINYDFEHVLSQFPSVSPNVFIAPAELPGTWQSREPDIASPNRDSHKLDGPRLNDRIWLPSSFELGDGNVGNLWNATRNETAKLDGETNGFNMWSWTRSRATVGALDSVRIFSGRDYSSHFSNRSVSNPIGIRPAIHLDMTLLVPVLETPNVDVTRTLADQLTVEWDAVENVVSYRVRVGTGAWQTINSSTTKFEYTISSTGTFTFQVYAVGDGFAHANSDVANAKIIVNQVPLGTPFGLQIDEGVLTWDSIDSLGTYVVYRNGTLYSSELATTSWIIPASWGPATWNLRVKATASSSPWFLDSELSDGENHIIPLPEVTDIKITQNTTKQTWWASETFSASGIVLAITYSDGTTRTQNDISLMTVTHGSWVAGPVTISVEYAGLTTTFTVTVLNSTNNYNVVVVDGEEFAIVLGTFYLVGDLVMPYVRAGYEFVGWSTDGGLTILADTDILEPGMVLTSIMVREVQNNGDTFPWIIIGVVSAVLVLIAIAILIIIVRRKKKRLQRA